MNSETLSTILMRMAGSDLGKLASGMFLTAGTHIAKEVQAGPANKALRVALETAFITATETLLEDASKLTQYHTDCFTGFLRHPTVHQELAVLLNPRPLSLPEAAAIIDNLRSAFTEITKGVPPENISDIDFDSYITAFLKSFYDSTQKQAELQKVIQIQLLGRMTLQLTELIAINQRIEKGVQATASNTVGIADTAPLAPKLDIIAGELQLLQETLEVEHILIEEETNTELALQIEALKGLLGSLRPKPDTELVSNAKIMQPGSAPPLPNLIIGREDALQELKQRLGVLDAERDSRKLQVLTAMRGWPGTGKTTLAAALSYDPEIAQVFPDGTLWASLGQSPNILSELATWGRALGTDTVLHAKSVDEASAQLRAILKNQSRLLIIDDVWEAEHAIPFNVGGPHCATLITTRLPVVASAIVSAPEDVFVLPVLTDEKAYELLKWLAPRAVARHPDETRILVKELEGLPLALQVAGRLLHSEASIGFEIPDLIEELRTGAKLIEARPPADRIELANETTLTVATLLQRSTERLDPVTLDCFAYLGAFAPRPATFDLEALAYVWEVEDPKPIVRTLVARGLLEPIPETGRFQMHPLLIMHAQSLLTEG